MGDGNVVEEFGAAEDEAFAPGGGFAKELERVVGEDAHYQVVVFFGCAFRAGVAAFALAGVGFAFFGVEGGRGEDDAVFRARFDRCDVGVGADVDAFGFEIVGPVAVEAF